MTPKKSKRQSHSSDGVDVGLELGGTVLKTLETIAKVSPVPGLSEAAKLALQITDTVKAARANKEGFKRLAADASQLVYVIISAHQNISREDQADPNLIENLDHVLVILDNIEELASKGASRSRFVAFWMSSFDAGKITEHRERLQQCLNKFGFESEISIRVIVVRLAAQHDKMMHLLESKDHRSNKVVKDQDRREAETAEVEEWAPRAEKDVGAYKDPDNQRTSNTSISIGSGANFSGAAGIAIGANNNVNYGVSG